MKRLLATLLIAAIGGLPASPGLSHCAPAPSVFWSGPAPRAPVDIQAVCRIDMKRGPDIEGVILLGTSYRHGSGSYWDANGFYFTRADGSSSAILFDKYYRYIKNGEITERQKHSMHHPPPKPKDVVAWPEHDQVYFLYARRSADHNAGERASLSTSIDSTSQPFIYRSEFVERFPVEYELLDYIPVYPKIPEGVTVHGAKRVKPLHVPLGEIDEFSIELQLSEKWAYDIDAARKRAERLNVNVRWFNAYTLPEFGTRTLYSPWENYVPPDSSRIRIDPPRRVRPFDLQGICHIETVDSQVVEGVVLVASDVRPNDGYDNVPETNGFWFPDDETYDGEKTDGLCLMPVSFGIWSDGSEQRVGLMPASVGWISSSPQAKNYYLKDVTVEKYGKGRFREVKSEIVREGSGPVLKRYVENRYPGAFEMLDCIPVYPEIPSERSLRGATSVQPVCVPVSKIREFWLGRYPDALWWTRIKLSELEAQKRFLHPDDVRWYFGGSSYYFQPHWIKPSSIHEIPRRGGGLDLSNIRGYQDTARE